MLNLGFAQSAASDKQNNIAIISNKLITRCDEMIGKRIYERKLAEYEATRRSN